MTQGLAPSGQILERRSDWGLDGNIPRIDNAAIKFSIQLARGKCARVDALVRLQMILHLPKSDPRADRWKGS